MNKNLLLLTSASLALMLSMQPAHSQNSKEPVVNKVVYEPDSYDNNDPFEAFNRPMFTFNMWLDDYLLRPAAIGYRKITPKFARDRIKSALYNLGEPISTINFLLQGEFFKSVKSLGRFAVNSTLGLAGTFDVATGWGWSNERTSLDETLANWCVPEGPYIVLPFVNSTTPRAMVADFTDNFAHPVYWATEDHEDGIYAYVGYQAFKAVTVRESNLEFIDDMKANSVDFYTAVRSAYMQNIKKSRCRADKQDSQAYDFDFEDDY